MMKVLLIGEYSNVHNTLAEGLRILGHKVVVASNGDFWKDYPRDIDLRRDAGVAGSISFFSRLVGALPRMKGYDVVQIINPMFMELKAEKILSIYRYLRRNNDKLVLGAFGMDYYWVHENITRKPLRYSDFNLGDQLRTDADAKKEIADWLDTTKGQLNQYIAHNCDAIVAGLYEYWACYHPLFPKKTFFIPFPIKPKMTIDDIEESVHLPIKMFIGVSRYRSSYKGTDVMLKAAQKIQEKYPGHVLLTVAQGFPFRQYVQMMSDSDVILDQLYSYTPAMNALEAMSRGVICVGGGEPENYSIINERQLHPIVNVEPDADSVFKALQQLIIHPEVIPSLKKQSIMYIQRHHDFIQVAKTYERLYLDLLGTSK